MVKWKFRSCSRCDGDIFIDRDLYGWFEQCIQCGYMRDLIDVVELGQQQACGIKGRGRRAATLSKRK